jgi:hypothetical protein
MGRNPRQRRYVSRVLLVVFRPLFRYSYGRSAYILRIVGERKGPVLRENRRRRQRAYDGPDRRGMLMGRDQHLIAGR